MSDNDKPKEPPINQDEYERDMLDMLHKSRYPKEHIPSVREQILATAQGLIGGERELAYGNPLRQLGFSRRLKAMFWDEWVVNAARSVSPAEWEAIDMILTKLSRLACGPAPGRDTYIDIAGYAAIAGEASAAAERLEEKAQEDA